MKKLIKYKLSNIETYGNFAENILHRIKAITTEIEFVRLYKKQPLFGDVDIFLRSKGFFLYNLYEL